MHYSLDDEDEFEIVEPIIAFFVHLDKNIDKLFKAITDVLQTLDVQYGNKTKEGQSQINDIVQMADDVAEFVKEKTGGGNSRTKRLTTKRTATARLQTRGSAWILTS